MQVIPELMDICLSQIAEHYGAKIIASEINPSADQVKSAVIANWDKISAEAADLYASVCVELHQDSRDSLQSQSNAATGQ